MILLLVANTSSLSQACELLLERAQLADSKTQYTLLSASLAYVTGSMLGVQRQLASSAQRGGAGGSSCPAAALLPCLPMLGCDMQRLQHVLSANPAALPDAFGCILLKRLSDVLTLASKWPSVTASGSVSHSPAAGSSTPHNSVAAAVARTAAKPAVLLPLLAQLLPCAERLRVADCGDNDGECGHVPSSRFPWQPLESACGAEHVLQSIPMSAQLLPAHTIPCCSHLAGCGAHHCDRASRCTSVQVPV